MSRSAADGVTADLPGLRQLAAAAHDRATDVRAIVTGLHKLPVGDENSFAGALAAYQALLGAWTDELGISAGALDELGEKLTQAAATYRRTDLHWSISPQQPAMPPTADRSVDPGSSSGLLSAQHLRQRGVAPGLHGRL